MPMLCTKRLQRECRFTRKCFGWALHHCRESIVTNMVRLKHGKDTIVSNKLVAEANISLSECQHVTGCSGRLSALASVPCRASRLDTAQQGWHAGRYNPAMHRSALSRHTSQRVSLFFRRSITPLNPHYTPQPPLHPSTPSSLTSVCSWEGRQGIGCGHVSTQKA